MKEETIACASEMGRVMLDHASLSFLVVFLYFQPFWALVAVDGFL